MHPGLAWLRKSAEGRAWLERLPTLLEECRERWALDLEEPYPYAFVSLAVPAGDVVLKIQFPGRESEHEAEALRVWDGDGAVRLVDHDPARNALLLERCRPGESLRSIPAPEALEVLAGLLPRLWKPARAPFRSLAEESAEWRESLPREWEQAGRPCERELVDAALAALDELPPTQGEQVLVHQDLHGDNVLSAEREPWLVIDPKPLAAEREFSLAPVIRSFDLGERREDVIGRLDRLSAQLGVDRDRARRWAIAQSLAWSFDSEYYDWHVRTARWLLEAA